MTEQQTLQERVDVPPEMADAVDLLVDRKGLEAAEADLEERFKTEGDDWSTAALAYLRRRYGGADA